MTREETRNNLNTLFLLLALIGVILYFAWPAHHVVGLVVIAVAMVVKIIEFFIRFFFFRQSFYTFFLRSCFFNQSFYTFFIRSFFFVRWWR